MAGKPRSKALPAGSGAALSWIPIDPDYDNRDGYDAAFLGTRIALPRPDDDRMLAADLLAPLKYQHFSVVLHRKRKLAAFTAVNIDGAKKYERSGREPDTWHEDPRAPGVQTMQAFYRKPFQRGHLVMRTDPAWGGKRAAERAEADTFHWTNCSPQHQRLNNPWWLSVETHILKTAQTAKRRVTVFSGPVFGRDPVIRGVKVPLAYWKVIAWKTPGANGALRSLGFLVRQDEVVRPLVRADSRALAVDFPDTPKKVQAYQVLVSALEPLVGLRFGRLAGAKVDAYALARASRPAGAALADIEAFRRLRRLGDLIVE